MHLNLEVLNLKNLLVFFLYYFRILFFLLPLDFFSLGIIPINVLALLLVSLTWLYLDLVPPSSIPEINSLLSLLLLISKEAFLGFLMGFFVKLIFVAFQILGEIINLHTGLAMANMMLPGLGQMGIFGNFFRILIILLFLSFGGLEIIFSLLKLSFQTIPIGSFDFFTLDYKYLFLLVVKIFTIALALALPIIAIYMIVNIVLAITNRLIPNVNIFFVGYPIYMLANFTALAFLIPALLLIGNYFLEKYLKIFESFLISFKHI
jgi:flagellar biosynthetic protein FliR